MEKKRKFKFYTIKFLAEYLGVSEKFFVDLSENKNKYYNISIDKDKKGKERIFYKSWGPLKKILIKIDKKILGRISYYKNFIGGVEGGSLKQNAQRHLGNKNILKLDIKSFYPSITPLMVKRAFLSLGMSQDCSDLLTEIVTVDSHLPQGFNTSPKLSALVLYPLDRQIYKLAKQNSWSYTYWIDDITISANTPIQPFRKIIFSIIERHGFKVNEEKTKFVNKRERMIITGIVINKKINVPKNKRQEIRQIIFYLKKFGINNYLIKKDLQINKENVKKLKQEIEGKIRYVKSINVELGNKLMKEFKMIDWRLKSVGLQKNN